MNNSNTNNRPKQDKGQARPRFSWTALQHALQFYQATHLCCIPVPFGEKKYNFQHAGNQGWESFQKERPSQRQIDQWFREDKPTGIAVVCGGVSNGLVVLDFNTSTGAIEFFGQELWEELLTTTFVVKTFRGYQVFFRLEKEFRGTYGYKPDSPIHPKPFMEIKAEGQYVVVPPSLHPEGIIYTNIGVEEIAKPKNFEIGIRKRAAHLNITLGIRTTEERAKPPLTEQEKKVEELLRKDLTLDEIAKELGLLRGQVMTSLQHIDLPSLFSELKGEGSPEHHFNATQCYDLLNQRRPWGDPSPKKELTLTQAIERYEEIYAKAVAEHAEEDDKLAVGKLLESCAFIQHCQEDATTLPEPHWYAMITNLVVFGEPGKEKIHELSKPYYSYSEEETGEKIAEAVEAVKAERSPQTCEYIEQNLGFPCPADCPAKKQGIKSPAGLAHRLATPKTFNLTDTGNAERLVRKHGSNLHYCEVRKKWLIWNGKVWKWNLGSKIMALAKETARAIYAEAANEVSDNKRADLVTHAKQSESRFRRAAMGDLAISEPGIPITLEELDTDPWLFNCKNGTLDLRTGELGPHDKNDLITHISPVEYSPDAECPLWLEFLKTVTNNDTGLQNYLQRAAGYSLCGDISTQVVFFLYGAGNNGKSTFLNILSEIIGDYSHKASMDIFTATKSGPQGHQEGVVNLQGARFVYAGEVEEGKKLAINLIKDMTGGEPIQGSRKYEHEIKFQPAFKLWLYGNHRPRVTDNTIATWRRLKEVPFTVVIPDSDIDEDLPKKLRAELPGILAWMVRGCLSKQKEKLGEPEAVKAATADFRLEMDVLSDFIEDYCLEQPAGTVSKTALHKAYTSWCEENKNKPLTQKTFKTRLTERGITDYKGAKGIRMWKGITLNTDHTWDMGDREEPPSQ